MDINLYDLRNKHYKPLIEGYSEAQLEEYVTVINKHRTLVEEHELQKIEAVNEPVFQGIDAFRMWLEQEKTKRGPFPLAETRLDRVIAKNRRLRENLDPGGDHNKWEGRAYLFSQEDHRNLTIQLDDKEQEMCHGAVTSKNGDTTWQIIDIPHWVKEYRGAPEEDAQLGQCPSHISEKDVDKYVAELDKMLSTSDNAKKSILSLSKQVRDVKKKAEQLKHWFTRYAENQADSASVIWSLKRQVHELQRIQLQTENIQKDNARLNKSATPKPVTRTQVPAKGPEWTPRDNITASAEQEL